MKTILLLSLFVLVNLFCQAQKRDEYLQWSKDTVREFPYLSSQISIYVQKEEARYLEVRDSVSGNKKIVPNTLHEGWDENWPVPDDPYRYVSINGYEEVNLPPVLDSLPDGWYVYYYVPLPIMDLDTLKWVEKKVAAIFQLRNNQPVGKVRWYYPQDGLLLQEGAYEEGMRSGDWFFQQIEGGYLGDAYWIPDIYLHTVSTSYKLGRKTGLEYSWNHYYLYEESPENTREFTEDKYVYYHNDTLHGEFKHLINGQIKTKGSFFYGLPNGNWEQYQWKDSVFGGELIPWMNYTYASDSVVHKRPFTIRTLKKERFNDATYWGDSGPLNMGVSYFSGYHTAEMTIKHTFNEELSDFLEVRNCLQQTITDYSVKKTPYFLSLLEWTRYQGAFRNDADAIYCGFHFRYSGVAKEYYPNGQLKWELNFDDPETLFNDTVYWQNGEPMNCMRHTTNGYEQIWYDKTGKVFEHIVYSDDLKQIGYLVNPDVLTIDGRKYTRSYGNLFTYNHPIVVLVSDTNAVLVSSTLNDYKGTSRTDLWYIPSERKGWQETTLGNGVLEKVTFQIDSTNQLYAAQSEVRFGNYTVYGTLQDTLFPKCFPTVGKSLLAGDTVLIDALNFPYVSGKIQNWVVKWKGKPFRGKVLISIDPNKPFLIRKKYDKLLVHLNDSSVKSGYKLFPGTGEYLWGNYPPPKKLASEPDTILRDALKAATLAQVKLSYNYGRLNGRSEFLGTNGCELALLNYADNKMHGTQVTTRLFPHLFWQYYSDRDYSYYNFEVADLNGIASTKRLLNQGKVISELILNSQADTLHFTQFKDQKPFGYFVSTEAYGYSTYQRTSGYYLNGNVILKKVVVNDIVIHTADYNNQSYQTFYRNGRISQRLRLRPNAETDTLFCFDTLGFIRYEQLWKDRVLSELKNYNNGFLTSTFTCSLFDSVFVRDETISTNFDLTSFCVQKLYINRLRPTGYMKSFLPDGSCWREGRIKEGEKAGTWNYYPQSGFAYQINYDSVIKEGYFKRYYPKLEAAGLKADLLDFEQEYNCLHNEHSERYVPSFSLLNSQLPPDTAVQIVWYYPTGVKMCEGPVVNGKPHGIWRLYHTDGSLYTLGTYQQGIREGKWISGDLSKVNFLGEYCLNPETDSYNDLLKELQVSTVYYRNGIKVGESESSFQVR